MSDLGHIARWLLALELLGWGLWPILALVMPGLRDRGLTLAKPFALLLCVFPVWFVAALGPPLFTGPIVIGAGLILAALGWLLVLRRERAARADAGPAPVSPPTTLAFLRGAWRYVALSEAVFIGGFLFYVWLRAITRRCLAPRSRWRWASSRRRRATTPCRRAIPG